MIYEYINIILEQLDFLIVVLKDHHFYDDMNSIHHLRGSLHTQAQLLWLIILGSLLDRRGVGSRPHTSAQLQWQSGGGGDGGGPRGGCLTPECGAPTQRWQLSPLFPSGEPRDGGTYRLPCRGSCKGWRRG